MNIPRVVIAGLYGEGGKTTIAMGLMCALAKKGLRVQPFKVGPDYIDGAYHFAAARRPSRHLDPWLTSPRTVLEIFERACENSDIAVVEGFMGLFDGITRVIDGIQDYGSTAQIARILKAPVVLVLDVNGMRINAAAVVHGFKSFDRQVKVAGIVLNNIRSVRQAEWIEETVESITKVPVLGRIPYDEAIFLPTRSGGLVPVPEQKNLETILSKLVDYINKRVDIGKVVEIAKHSRDLPYVHSAIYPPLPKKKNVRVGVAFDEAFNFVYPDNIDLLSAYGANIVFFSPLHDEKLPSDLDGIYIPGGFPDTRVEKLSKNQSMRTSIKKLVLDEIPVYSEHGGSLYLTDSITTVDDLTFSMVGALPVKSLMDKKLQALDSTLMETAKDNIVSKKGMVVHGHEYHFLKIVEIPKDAQFAFKMSVGRGITGQLEGFMENNILSLLGQLYFAYSKNLPLNFVKNCEKYRHR